MSTFMAEHQLDMMLALGSICGITAFYTSISNILARRRKVNMLVMELGSMILLFSDRLAYLYRGDVSDLGFAMTAVCNFLVYFMTIVIVLSVNIYLGDLTINECGDITKPVLLKYNSGVLLFGGLLIIISQFTGLYYTFDETNHYVRAPGFIICYIIPVLAAFIILYETMNHQKKLSRRIVVSLILFTVLPVIAGGIQVFTYGISLANITLGLMVLVIYTLALIDMNETVARAHQMEMEMLLEDQTRMKRLFDQTASAFVAAVEKRDFFVQGHSRRVANIARAIAEKAGKSQNECDDVFYAALLHDVGMIGIPDSVVEKETELTEEEYAIIKKKPVIAAEILSSITEYPFLSETARYACERYDGNGYPEGLKGDAIPEIARIVTVADSYDNMTSKKRFRDPIPLQIVREEVIKAAGNQFDPEFAEFMVQIIDEEKKNGGQEIAQLESDTVLDCRQYRSVVSVGVPVGEQSTRIRFDGRKTVEGNDAFSAPSIILFDSYDGCVHTDHRSIDAYRYVEYGELWFDGHIISTAARNMEVNVAEHDNSTLVTRRDDGEVTSAYVIIAMRSDDHVKVRLISDEHTTEVTVALPDRSKPVYIGVTGENCRLDGFRVEQKDIDSDSSDARIPRIAGEISYIDRMESDVPNVQVDRERSAYTEAIPINNNEMMIDFHTMSLPSANLVWHCPYIVIYYSSDRIVGGRGYREYALIKLNGECETEPGFAENRFSMKKKDSFPGWDVWKQFNKDGLECRVEITRSGDKVRVFSENLGIVIEDRIRIHDGAGEVFAALTGDQVALTDIRIK